MVVTKLTRLKLKFARSNSSSESLARSSCQLSVKYVGRGRAKDLCCVLQTVLSVLMAIFPSGPQLAATRMSTFWMLLELRMMEVVSGDNWSYKSCKAPVKSSPSTN